MDEVERQQTTGSSMQPLLGKQATPLEGKPHREIRKNCVFGHCPYLGIAQMGRAPCPTGFGTSAVNINHC